MIFLKNIYEFILGFIFPNICCICNNRLNDEVLVCSNCWDSLEPIKDQESSTVDNAYYSSINAIWDFSDTFKEIIHLLKYEKKLIIGQIIANKLYKSYKKDFFFKFDIIIPVPLHHTRLRERGYNQAYVIAKELSKLSNIKVKKNILKRKSNNISQTHLSKQERAKNIDALFGINSKNKNAIKEIENKKILIIDDVYTTGATVNGCAKVLKEAGAKSIEILTAARA